MNPTVDEMEAIVQRIKRHRLLIETATLADIHGHHAGTMQGGHPDEIARLKEQTR